LCEQEVANVNEFISFVFPPSSELLPELLAALREAFRDVLPESSLTLAGIAAALVAISREIGRRTNDTMLLDMLELFSGASEITIASSELGLRCNFYSYAMTCSFVLQFLVI
jgi:hypothetical protein